MPITTDERSAADRIEGLRPDLEEWRHDFHRHPELSFAEKRTSQRVAERLESFGVEVHRGLAGTGVVGTLRGGSSERSIALRADMDALPITEVADRPYRSATPGVMHACGHDGHTTMLLGAARSLAETRRFDGTVYFIFQPAEEKDGGGRVMIEEGLFDRFPALEVYGMHNFPGLPVGEFALCLGPMMAAIDTFEIVIKGEGGHAAWPHETVDTVLVSGEVLVALQSIVSRSVDPLKNAVVSVTQTHGGDAHNVIPDRVVLSGCSRSFLPEVQDTIEDRMRALVAGISSAHGAGHEVHYRRYYPATVNSPEETEKAARSAGAVGTHVTTDMTPVMGSEDFSFMLRERPGAFIFIGNGSSSRLHTPTYDFNDEVLPLGVRYWVHLTETLLGGGPGSATSSP